MKTSCTAIPKKYLLEGLTDYKNFKSSCKITNFCRSFFAAYTELQETQKGNFAFGAKLLSEKMLAQYF
jgi:hypothetical protein